MGHSAANLLVSLCVLYSVLLLLTQCNQCSVFFCVMWHSLSLVQRIKSVYAGIEMLHI